MRHGHRRKRLLRRVRSVETAAAAVDLDIDEPRCEMTPVEVDRLDSAFRPECILMDHRRHPLVLHDHGMIGEPLAAGVDARVDECIWS